MIKPLHDGRHHRVRLSIIIPILLLTFSSNYAQDNYCFYFPLQTGRSWIYKRVDHADSLTSLIIDTTTIKNNLYSIFAPYGRDPDNNWPKYWLRPDSNRIFAFNEQDSAEYLVFDFTAEINDIWGIPAVPMPPSHQPMNQCDWGSQVSLVSRTDSVIAPHRTFYHCYHFVHLGHPCSDTGILSTWFARDFGIVCFSQNTEAGVIEWILVSDAADTTTHAGIYTIIGNPCLSSPCLPGVVSALIANDTTYVLSTNDNWYWNGDFSWDEYRPALGDSVLVTGIVTERTDIFGKKYFTLEILNFSKYTPASIPANSAEVSETKFLLKQNNPNPFNMETRIEYVLAKTGHVKIVLYDITGKKVKTILNETESRGHHTILVNAEKMGSGIYYYQLISDQYIQTKSMILIK